MKDIASLVPILALCLAACTTSGTEPGPDKSCAERNTSLYEEVTEFRDAHPTQDPRITGLRPYPPLIEPLNGHGASRLQVQDDLDPGKPGYIGPEGVILWIPPVGFDPVTGNSSPVLHMDTAINGVETSSPVVKPVEMSLVQIVSEGGYVARVRIFDSANRLVRESTQTFGYRGELMNRNRVVPNGLVSFLVWNSRDRNGALVADGAYLWRISFTFKDGTEYHATTKTGFFNTVCPVN